MRRIHLPSPAMTVAVVALVFAAAGTSYAMTLPKNSVGSRQLKKHAVTTPKLADSAAARIAGLTYQKGTVTMPANMAGAIHIMCPKGLVALGGALEAPHTVDAPF